MDRQRETAARVDKCLRQMGLAGLSADRLKGIDLPTWTFVYFRGSTCHESHVPEEIRQEFAEATIAYAEAMGYDEMAVGLREDLVKGQKGIPWPYAQTAAPPQVSAAPKVPPDPRVAATCDRTRLFLSSLEYLSVGDSRKASELRHRLRAPGLGVLHEAVLFLGGVYPARPGQGELVADLMRLVGSDRPGPTYEVETPLARCQRAHILGSGPRCATGYCARCCKATCPEGHYAAACEAIKEQLRRRER